MSKFSEECFQTEIANILKQTYVFMLSLVVELLAVLCLRLFRDEMKKSCDNIDTERFFFVITDAEGCEFNSNKNFSLLITWMVLDSLSKFTYCSYFLYIQHCKFRYGVRFASAHMYAEESQTTYGTIVRYSALPEPNLLTG